MISNTNLSVRVCGVVVASLKIRQQIRDGRLTGQREVVFRDPILGSFCLDDSFVIELRDLNAPWEERRWCQTDVGGLLAALGETGAIPS